MCKALRTDSGLYLVLCIIIITSTITTTTNINSQIALQM